jgi:hypothetical protein
VEIASGLDVCCHLSVMPLLLARAVATENDWGCSSVRLAQLANHDRALAVLAVKDDRRNASVDGEDPEAAR